MTSCTLPRALAGALVALALTPAAAGAVTTVRNPTIAPFDEPKREGQALAADDGEYSYEDPATASLTRSWLRCDPAGANCGVLSHETFYNVVADDIGSTIRLRVSATCTGCVAAVADSTPTGPIRSDPSNEVPPVIAGQPRLGRPLELFRGTWSGTQPILYGVQWQRCPALPAQTKDCVNIVGATEDFYVPRAPDLGRRLRARVTADNGRPGSRSVSTALTEPLRAALMSPFPLVAIGGRLAPGGAKVSLLRVRGGSGALVSVRCIGPTCPLRRILRTIGDTGVVRLGALERTLGAGTKLDVRVTRPGVIGKYVRFRIRRRRAPARRDACLVPGSRLPRVCPAG